jgi:aryl-alcohol dehydrogenase-like predicted oxidoreductase
MRRHRDCRPFGVEPGL